MPISFVGSSNVKNKVWSTGFYEVWITGLAKCGVFSVLTTLLSEEWEVGKFIPIGRKIIFYENF